MAEKILSTLEFDKSEREAVNLVLHELASNLVKHAGRGTLVISPVEKDGIAGIQIESVDDSPGILDLERAMTDGFSTSGSLGYGLGTVNRLMDEFKIESSPEAGTHITCHRWKRSLQAGTALCPLTFGAATRQYPGMKINGDAFIIKKWNDSVMVGVIDGLGHGQWAQRASQTAKNYIESHVTQPLADIFRGTGRSCRSTRGVVMALARFDWLQEKVTIASIGNVDVRIFNNDEPLKLIVRRGIVGLNAPNPVVSEQHWNPEGIMILHSDGLRTRWRLEDFPGLENRQANVIARQLLHHLARDNDDATVVVVKGKNND